MILFKTAYKLAIDEFTWIKPILSAWDLERALKRYRNIRKKVILKHDSFAAGEVART